MDLNEVPCDSMVNGVKIEEKTMGNFDCVGDKKLGCSRIMSDELEVEQRVKEVEEKSLVLELEIRNKEKKLEEIEAKIRVLGNEKVRIEEEIRGFKKKKKGEEGAVDGGEAGETKSGEFSLNECEMKSDEVSRVDQLMIENRRLECERNVAIKEVEFWEQKCKKLESQMIGLEGRLKKKDIKANGAAPMNYGVVCGSRHLGSPSCGPDAMGGVMLVEGTADNQCLDTKDTPTMEIHVKRRLAYRNKRRCEEKIAPPPTPAGGKSSASSIIDIIDSDKECDVHDRHKPCSKSEKGVYTMLEHIEENMDDALSEKKQSGGRGDSPSTLTPITKRKRDLLVVTSDDECENIGCTPSKRALKIENSDNEGEEDDEKIKTVRQVSKKIASESDDDDKPINQLIRRCAHQCLSQTSGSLKPTRPRRRLVKYGQAEQRNKPQEVENHFDTLTTENAANDDSSEEDSESSVRSLSNFIVDDSDDEDVEYDALKEDSEKDDALKEDNEEDDALKEDSEKSEDHSVELEDDDSDSNLNYDDIISSFRSKRYPNSKWISEGDMLSDFGKNPELCMRAVCALYRQQTNEEQASKASFVNNGRGFSKFDATRGSRLGDFLTDGDPTGDLVKSVEELQEFHYDGLEECRALAYRYSKQLFNIYINKEDPFFS